MIEWSNRAEFFNILKIFKHRIFLRNIFKSFLFIYWLSAWLIENMSSFSFFVLFFISEPDFDTSRKKINRLYSYCPPTKDIKWVIKRSFENNKQFFFHIICIDNMTTVSRKIQVSQKFVDIHLEFIYLVATREAGWIWCGNRSSSYWCESKSTESCWW